MFAFLSLIPGKDICYAGAIIALLVAFGLYSEHERSVGEAHEVAAVNKAVAAQTRETQKVVSNANVQITAAEQIARSVIGSAPDVDAPHVLVRVGAGQGACAVSPNPGAVSGSHAAAESSVEHTIDIGPPLDTIGRDADAEIVYLQTYIRDCQTAGYCAK